MNRTANLQPTCSPQQATKDGIEKTGWVVHALCLMNNHFHLVAETPRGNLVDDMRWFLGAYTARFNRQEASQASVSPHYLHKNLDDRS